MQLISDEIPDCGRVGGSVSTGMLIATHHFHSRFSGQNLGRAIPAPNLDHSKFSLSRKYHCVGAISGLQMSLIKPQPLSDDDGLGNHAVFGVGMYAHLNG
jgi:hypothetical protein